MIAAILCLAASADDACGAENWAVSIRRSPIEQGERVVGLEVTVTAGRVVTMPSFPVGWAFNIDNDASWHASARGSILVGAAAVSESFFHDFIVVEKHEFGDLRFDVRVLLVVTQDFEKERRIQLGMKDLILRRK